MRAALLALLLVACGGDGSGATDTDTDDTDGGDPGTVTCDDLPPFDLETLSCDQLVNALDQTLDAAEDCVDASDCVVHRATCETWVQAECWYVSNDCVPSISQFNSAAGGCAVGGMVCECGDEPEVDCVSGRCVLVQ